MNQYTTGVVSSLVAALLIVAQVAGVEMSEHVATAVVTLVAVLTSAMFPRWYSLQGFTVDAHPAAITSLVVTIVVWVAAALGLEIDAAAATVIVSALTTLVSLFTPRQLSSWSDPLVSADAIHADHDAATRDEPRD